MEECSFIIGGHLPEVEPLQEEIQGILQASGFRLKQIHATVLALGEWLEYAIQNFPDDQSARRVSISLGVGESQIRLRVQDNGPQLALPGREAATETIPPAQPNSAGLNLHLLRSLVDEIQLHRIDGCNVVEFSKQVVQPA